MKKRTILWIVLLTLLLIILDQGAKQLVKRFYVEREHESYTLRIHPVVNDATAQKFTALSEETGMNYSLLLILDMLKEFFDYALLLAVACLVSRFFFWDMDMKKFTVFTGMIISLIAAGTISHYLDSLLWHGCLDFICVSWDVKVPVGDHFHTAVHHEALDIKDLYLYSGAALLFVRVVIWEIQLLRYAIKNKENLIQKLKHPIRNFKAMFGK